jgi:NitT/TauT family transport system substrate-binding protein
MLSRSVFLASVSAAAVAAPVIANAQAPVHVTIGTTPIDAGLAPVIGVRTGIYKKYGLDAELVTMNSGAAMSAAVAGGSLQVGSSSLMGLITAHVRGVPFQIVAPANIYTTDRPGEALIVRTDSPIRTAADLSGKTFASTALGDLLSIGSLLWIDQNGGDSKAVREIELPTATIPAALEAGRVDAAAIAEPRLSNLVQSGAARILAKMYDAIAKHFLIAAFFIRTDYGDANRDTLVRLARATREINAFANAHPDQTAPWLAELAKVDIATIASGKREIFAETLSLGEIQPVIEAAARYKTIDRVFDARELVAPAVLNVR